MRHEKAESIRPVGLNEFEKILRHTTLGTQKRHEGKVVLSHIRCKATLLTTIEELRF